jgi:hypothetical protein
MSSSSGDNTHQLREQLQRLSWAHDETVRGHTDLCIKGHVMTSLCIVDVRRALVNAGYPASVVDHATITSWPSQSRTEFTLQVPADYRPRPPWSRRKKWTVLALTLLTMVLAWFVMGWAMTRMGYRDPWRDVWQWGCQWGCKVYHRYPSSAPLPQTSAS